MSCEGCGCSKTQAEKDYVFEANVSRVAWEAANPLPMGHFPALPEVVVTEAHGRESVEIGEWSFDPEDDDSVEDADHAILVWTAYRNWLAARG